MMRRCALDHKAAGPKTVNLKAGVWPVPRPAGMPALSCLSFDRPDHPCAVMSGHNDHGCYMHKVPRSICIQAVVATV